MLVLEYKAVVSKKQKLARNEAIRNYPVHQKQGYTLLDGCAQRSQAQ